MSNFEARNILYKKFSTGLSFTEVRNILAREQKLKRENFEYMFVTRSTVLGRWRELKLKMFNAVYPPELSTRELLNALNSPAENFSIDYSNEDFII